MNGKIKNSKEIGQLASELKRTGKSIVFTNGCFDILHKGHLDLLKKAKSLGDILIVGLNNDTSVKKIKGPNRPVNNEKNRAFVLSCISFVDYVTLFSGTTPIKAIKSVRPDILVKGGDWKVKDIVGGDFVTMEGGRVVSIPLTRGYSTSRIIEKMAGINKRGRKPMGKR